MNRVDVDELRGTIQALVTQIREERELNGDTSHLNLALLHALTSQMAWALGDAEECHRHDQLACDASKNALDLNPSCPLP